MVNVCFLDSSGRDKTMLPIIVIQIGYLHVFTTRRCMHKSVTTDIDAYMGDLVFRNPEKNQVTRSHVCTANLFCIA